MIQENSHQRVAALVRSGSTISSNADAYQQSRGQRSVEAGSIHESAVCGEIQRINRHESTHRNQPRFEKVQAFSTLLQNGRRHHMEKKEKVPQQTFGRFVREVSHQARKLQRRETHTMGPGISVAREFVPNREPICNVCKLSRRFIQADPGPHGHHEECREEAKTPSSRTWKKSKCVRATITSQLPLPKQRHVTLYKPEKVFGQIYKWWAARTVL